MSDDRDLTGRPEQPVDPILSDPSLSDPNPSDPWAVLRQATRARVGLGRAGNAIPMDEVLRFQAAHALARDAVHAGLDVTILEQALAPLATITVSSMAPERATYLRRPDMGRLLTPGDADRLKAVGGPFDIVFVVGDGLSATAVLHHAAPVLHACHRTLPDLSIAPIVIARQARVAIADPIGAALGARISVILIGERPGLTVSDSLGLYLTHDPRPGRRDSERNCISNVHDHGGQSYEQAAQTLTWLVREALRRSLSGVALKEERGTTVLEAPMTVSSIAGRPSQGGT
ncbi:ethanolamine ammonia-lyase subunit EutC [Sphingomonas sp.]|uniref:ethanolamine ammonia-lyase subunit EutC n=1 Tax=Sphingomonas sp. TaxID=28214 RepID=UPI0031DC3FF6